MDCAFSKSFALSALTTAVKNKACISTILLISAFTASPLFLLPIPYNKQLQFKAMRAVCAVLSLQTRLSLKTTYYQFNNAYVATTLFCCWAISKRTAVKCFTVHSACVSSSPLIKFLTSCCDFRSRYRGRVSGTTLHIPLIMLSLIPARKRSSNARFIHHFPPGLFRTFTTLSTTSRRCFKLPVCIRSGRSFSALASWKYNSWDTGVERVVFFVFLTSASAISSSGAVFLWGYDALDICGAFDKRLVLPT